MIYNVQRTAPVNDTKPQQIAVDMKPVMNIFLSQLKLLLGWKPVVSMQVKCFIIVRAQYAITAVWGSYGNHDDNGNKNIAKQIKVVLVMVLHRRYKFYRP